MKAQYAGSSAVYKVQIRHMKDTLDVRIYNVQKHRLNKRQMFENRRSSVFNFTALYFNINTYIVSVLQLFQICKPQHT